MMKKLLSFLFFLALIMLSMVSFDSDAQNGADKIVFSSSSPSNRQTYLVTDYSFILLTNTTDNLKGYYFDDQFFLTCRLKNNYANEDEISCIPLSYCH